MSTAQHGGTEEKALDFGARDSLTKPVGAHSLFARMRALLTRINV